ncbi:DMT family transporter [Roseovarius arcticus]|uniref:DMT family transporter n=1 Tax=Roseovarius arcticus TaxID=2547404 RepID=UPI001110ADA7|nr:DMT family transporter [Roseovarius arcticus]
MRLILLTALAMAAFAANSVLNRAALTGGGIDPVSFGTVRLISGAAMLVILSTARRRNVTLRGMTRWIGVAALLIYVFAFSLAYQRLDAGLGALILFGCVQITMFAGALVARESVPPLRWLGAGIAFSGLIWLLWPDGGAEVPPLYGMAMAAAGAAWGVYSLAGRGGGDPLAGTAANFVLAAIIAVPLTVAIAVWPGAAALHIHWGGAAMASLSGAVTSGLGYALWYAVLPRLAATTAATAQLSVPIIAMAGGVVMLSEPLTGTFALAAALVLGGVALSILRR